MLLSIPCNSDLEISFPLNQPIITNFIGVGSLAQKSREHLKGPSVRRFRAETTQLATRFERDTLVKITPILRSYSAVSTAIRHLQLTEFRTGRGSVIFCPRQRYI